MSMNCVTSSTVMTQGAGNDKLACVNYAFLRMKIDLSNFMIHSFSKLYKLFLFASATYLPPITLTFQRYENIIKLMRLTGCILVCVSDGDVRPLESVGLVPSTLHDLLAVHDR